VASCLGGETVVAGGDRGVEDLSRVEVGDTSGPVEG